MDLRHSQTPIISPTADVIAFDTHIWNSVVGASTSVCVCVYTLVCVKKWEQAVDSGHWEIKEHFVMHP